MDTTKSVFVIDENIERRQNLETILSFLGEGWQSYDSHIDISAKIDLAANSVIVSSDRYSEKELFALLDANPMNPFLTFGTEETASKQGNLIGHIEHPFSYHQLTLLLGRCQSYRQCVTSKLGQSTSASKALIKQLIGRGDAIQSVRHLITQVATKSANVLVLGESGTGKEVIARSIHDASSRSKGPFVPVNCGAIPAELLESELFGHEKGAFTGAFSARKGRFELASGGTLFLDEIGDMPQPMQVKLLRVLQERVFERVGGSKAIKADVRIIAATHRNLEQMILDGEFREDLYYRLNVFPIESPALRARPDDIPLLIQELLRRHEAEHDATILFTQRAMESLMQHSWPGNVRELSNLIERLLIMTAGNIVDIGELPAKYRYNDDGESQIISSELPSELAERDAISAMFNDDIFADIEEESQEDGFFSMPNSLPERGVNLKEMLAEFEIDMIKQALDQQAHVVARAADQLGMRRTTLVEKMRKYGLQKEA
ncbi:sigma-54-dependent Fis family transcriptional regulator [Moritella sp. 5]|uniref:sigma-54 dependent transcriptional regulator n=1 Tax=Moritella sp. 5 TaxID=2746231 RepID=UPI001BAD5E39|nr:sigma-54 dependent transcriptional regulator [Moritella sp. 5]QUM79739.1 sigma-54-dependent Fis family transcriptional regulator [Moritella sp. 5]